MIIAMITSMGSMNVHALNTTTDPIYLSDGYSTNDNTYPRTTWNLSTRGKYDFSGDAYGKATLYSNYLFTGVDRLDITVFNTGTNSITVTVKKDGLIDTVVGSFTVSAGGTAVKYYDVDDNSKYYLCFSGPCHFNGWIM